VAQTAQNPPTTETVPVGQANARPASNGSGPSAAPPAPQRRSRLGLVLGIVFVILLAGGYFGFRYYEDQLYYVSTDNATVSGQLVQIGSLNAGQVANVSVDIGDRVAKGQVVANVTIPSAISVGPSGTPKMGFRGTEDQQAQVVSPVDGVVVARPAGPGDTVAVGQSIVTVVEPSRLWVQANVDENKVGRVKPGQNVEVTIDALNTTLPGRVLAVGRATAGTFSLIPQSNTTGNYTRVTQLVPVKIAVDYGDLPLTLGASASVKIRVQE
jgi:multidrug resistance efflux pump